MNIKRAFTLIELLVVIAIIAILAAILFPVFAQAKMAAKSTADLSDCKQLTTAIIIYENDFDDMIPPGNDGGNGSPTTWVGKTSPYVKSLGLFQSPVDGDTKNHQASWATWYSGAVGISFAPNGYLHDKSGPTGDWSNCDYGKPDFPCVLGGLMNEDDQAGSTNAIAHGGQGFLMPFAKSSTGVNHLSDTVLLADLYNSDFFAASGSGFGNDTVWNAACFYLINSTSDDWFGPEEIPDGKLTATNTYPHGPDGGVSLKGRPKANFSFADGHSKAMKPAATDPDPVNQPQNNMWDADRN